MREIVSTHGSGKTGGGESPFKADPDVSRLKKHFEIAPGVRAGLKEYLKAAPDVQARLKKCV